MAAGESDDGSMLSRVSLKFDVFDVEVDIDIDIDPDVAAVAADCGNSSNGEGDDILRPAHEEDRPAGAGDDRFADAGFLLSAPDDGGGGDEDNGKDDEGKEDASVTDGSIACEYADGKSPCGFLFHSSISTNFLISLISASVVKDTALCFLTASRRSACS